MEITFIVEYPPEGLVSFQDLINKNTSPYRTHLGFFHGPLGNIVWISGIIQWTEFIGDIVIWIITQGWVVVPIPVNIAKRCQVITLVL